MASAMGSDSRNPDTATQNLLKLFVETRSNQIWDFENNNYNGG
jgi:hypothetical protein